VICNPSLEEAGAWPGSAKYWEIGEGHARSDDRARSGGWSLKLSANGSSSTGRLTPESSVRISCWAWVEPSAGHVFINNDVDAGCPYRLELWPLPVTGWQQLSGYWSGDWCGVLTSAVQVIGGGGSGAIWLDDFEMAPSGGPGDTVINPATGHTYTVFENGTMSWQQAQEFCRQRGGHLATLATVEEWALMCSNFFGIWGQDRYMVGLTREGTGQWRWISGEPFDSVQSYYAPMFSPSSDYAAVGVPDYKLGYVDGEEGQCFICEWGVGYTPTPEPSATPTIEPTATPQPSATPTVEPTATVLPCPHHGDVNGDGQVTPGDAQRAFFYYLACLEQNPTRDQYCAADFCGSGEIEPCDNSVTPADAQGIMRFYLGYAEPCAKRSIANTTAGSIAIEITGADTAGQTEAAVVIAGETQEISAFGMQVRFDPEQLAFKEARPGTLDPGWLMFGARESAPGVVTAGAVSLESLPAGSAGSLMRLLFVQSGGKPAAAGSLTLSDLADDVSALAIQPSARVSSPSAQEASDSP